MSTIQELEQKIQRLEREIIENRQKEQELLSKSDKALDYALHAYKIDHNGYVWVWDTERKGYKKTNIHICTPEVEDKSITERKMADDAVSTRTIQGKAVTNPKIGDNAVDGRTIAPKSIDTKHIKDKAVTPEKLSGRVVKEVIDPLLNPLYDKDKHLQNQINLLISSGSEYGNAREFRKLWLKIAEMTGEDYSEGVHNLKLGVTPKYFIGENGCTVNITATTEGLDTVFEHIAFYINEKLVVQHDDTDYMQHETEIFGTSVIKCIATILGETYVEERTVTHYSSFWMGAGQAYTDVMKKANFVSLDNGWRLAKDVNVGDGEHIIIVLGESLREGFIRADINGIELKFSESVVIVDDEAYVVLVSEDTFNAGTYNIDING